MPPGGIEIKLLAVKQVDLGQRFKFGTNAFHVHVMSQVERRTRRTDFLTIPSRIAMAYAGLGGLSDV